MRRLICLAETDSTNSWLRRQKRVAPFTSVRAVRQTAGRGREEREWYSGQEDENLAFSILLPPAMSSAGIYPARVALTLHRALLPWVATRIKWPNDLLIGERKLAGVLCEMHAGLNSPVIAGIGLNVGTRSFPDAIAETATSLARECNTAPSVQKLWLTLTLALWREFRRERAPADLIHAYNRVASRYHRRREFSGEVLEFRSLLIDGTAEFQLRGERLILSQAV